MPLRDAFLVRDRILGKPVAKWINISERISVEDLFCGVIKEANRIGSQRG